MKFYQKPPLLKRGKHFSVIEENLSLINSGYFGQLTNRIRDFFRGKFCGILPKNSTTEGKKISRSSGKILNQLIVTILGKWQKE
ncbi:MAG: hypothetical protein F6K23_02845 [Okeania sp. SIO2C9]|uniref:hypothetical protein n=1 Tax=Okeania sp. SIO2C9 TaxID=2607791 RepID=UPI0013C1A8E3|nr:hypothetical protein [Okeania sp. SIO2C9]NEQ72106.1 hypothetical protein [Okeania sp. SIO2C9]